MNPQATVSFTHAQFNTEVTIFPDMVLAVTVAPQMKATVIVGSGGAAVPVLESIEQVKSKLIAAKAAPNTVQGGQDNGVPKRRSQINKRAR